MLAVDVAGVVLVAGILVLCGTTTITALTLPSFSPTLRRRQRRRRVPFAVEPKAPLALPPAPRHRRSSADGPVRDGDIDAAWDLIERLLEHDPDRLADVLTRWISSAHDPDDDSEENTRS